MATRHDRHPDETEVEHDAGQKMVREEHHKEELEGDLKVQQGRKRRKLVRHQPSPEPVREPRDKGSDDVCKPDAT